MPKSEQPNTVTVTTKLVELDASQEDGLLRIALEAPGFEIGRQIAPFLFANVTITFSEAPAPTKARKVKSK